MGAREQDLASREYFPSIRFQLQVQLLPRPRTDLGPGSAQRGTSFGNIHRIRKADQEVLCFC